MQRNQSFPWLLAGIAAIVAIALISVSPVRRGAKRPAPKPAPAAPSARAEDDGRGDRREPIISLYVAETGQTKRIKMEDYIAGVVAAEMRPDWPRQALAAQAILARTFTVERMSRGKTKRGTDASTDVKEFQAYAPEKVNDAVRDAVRSTRGKIITYHGRPVRAYFHSCAGGVTSTAEEGLAFTKEPTPYLKVVKDAPCADRTEERWVAVFGKREILAALRKMGIKLSDFGSVRVAGRGPSGRATLIAFDQTPVSAPGLRVALDPNRMKSTLLESVALQGGQVHMRGRGWGHGVGMSQWGAYDKANKGWDAERILNYYYRDIKIEKRWD